MKSIILLGAAMIGDTMRYPSEGSLSVDPKVADDLIAVGLAKPDDLATQKVADLHATAAAEGVPIGPVATKAETIEAIQDRRSNKA